MKKIHKKKIVMPALAALIVMAALLITSCGEASSGEEAGYQSVNSTAAAEMMETEENYIILDVRTADEYAEKHIPDAVNVPVESIGDEAPAELPEKDQLILVYCRSGNRSKQASAKLAGLGYTNIVEFGGINSWTGETVSDK